MKTVLLALVPPVAHPAHLARICCVTGTLLMIWVAVGVTGSTATPDSRMVTLATYDRYLKMGLHVRA